MPVISDLRAPPRRYGRTNRGRADVYQLTLRLLDSAVKLPMAPLAHPENISHAFIEYPLVRQVSALFAIPTPANLTLSLRSHASRTSQHPPARRLQVSCILGVRLGGLLLASAV
jgi:hypothetical protein